MPTNSGDWKEWAWPVPIWQGRFPVVSNPYGGTYPDGHVHLGVDIMYRRLPGKDPEKADDPQGVSGTLQKSGLFYMPNGIQVVAAQQGDVWSISKTKKGIAVVIEHGPLPYTTFYQHMSDVFVTKGQSVTRGTPIGIVGAGEEKGALRHLHFELTKWGPKKGQKTVMNPQPVMDAQWGHYDESGNFFPGAGLPVKKKVPKSGGDDSMVWLLLLAGGALAIAASTGRG